MSRLDDIKVGTLIEYYRGQSNYDIGYVKDIIKLSDDTEYHVCWFLGKYDTVENEESFDLWEDCVFYKVKT